MTLQNAMQIASIEGWCEEIIAERSDTNTVITQKARPLSAAQGHLIKYEKGNLIDVLKLSASVIDYNDWDEVVKIHTYDVKDVSPKTWAGDQILKQSHKLNYSDDRMVFFCPPQRECL